MSNKRVYARFGIFAVVAEGFVLPECGTTSLEN
jgi:hypothetical protein